MNHEDLFEAIGVADEALLEKSEQKPLQRRRRMLFFCDLFKDTV